MFPALREETAPDLRLPSRTTMPPGPDRRKLQRHVAAELAVEDARLLVQTRRMANLATAGETAISLHGSVKRMAEAEAIQFPQERAGGDALADIVTAGLAALLTEMAQR